MNSNREYWDIVCPHCHRISLLQYTIIPVKHSKLYSFVFQKPRIEQKSKCNLCGRNVGIHTGLMPYPMPEEKNTITTSDQLIAHLKEFGTAPFSVIERRKEETASVSTIIIFRKMNCNDFGRKAKIYYCLSALIRKFEAATIITVHYQYSKRG